MKILVLKSEAIQKQNPSEFYHLNQNLVHHIGIVHPPPKIRPQRTNIQARLLVFVLQIPSTHVVRVGHRGNGATRHRCIALSGQGSVPFVCAGAKADFEANGLVAVLFVDCCHFKNRREEEDVVVSQEG